MKCPTGYQLLPNLRSSQSFYTTIGTVISSVMNHTVVGFDVTFSKGKIKTVIHHSGFWEALYFGDPGQEDGLI